MGHFSLFGILCRFIQFDCEWLCWDTVHFLKISALWLKWIEVSHLDSSNDAVEEVHFSWITSANHSAVERYNLMRQNEPQLPLSPGDDNKVWETLTFHKPGARSRGWLEWTRDKLLWIIGRTPNVRSNIPYFVNIVSSLFLQIINTKLWFAK